MTGADRYTVLTGDSRALLPTLEAASVDAIVTDPPYELGFMGKAWDATGIAYDVSLWREALRVLKPGGHLLAFGGSRTYHRLASAVEDAGFEIRDQIMWLYGSGFPKSHNLEGEHDGWGTALKPAHEPIVMARKPLTGTVAENVQAHGTGALNIDGARVKTGGETTERRGFAEMGYHGRNRPGPYETGSTEGRWPANVTHDGSPEVLAAFPLAPGQQGAVGPQHGARPSINTYGDYGPRQDFHPRADSGSAARFFYTAKASPTDRDEGLDHLPAQPGGIKNGSGRGYSAGDPYAVVNVRNPHPTVKPTDLMRWLVRLTTPPGGLVLDPFTGSGSTGKAAMLEGFRYLGIEQEPEYAQIAQARIRHALRERLAIEAQPTLFAEVPA